MEQESFILELGTWEKNAGILGMIRILEMAGKKVDIQPGNQTVEIPISYLENFEQDYFAYFRNNNTEFLSFTKVREHFKKVQQLSGDVTLEQRQKVLEESTKYVKTKIMSNSYKSAYNLVGIDESNIVLLAKQLKETIKGKKGEDLTPHIEQQQQIYQQLTPIFEENMELQKYIYAKNTMYEIIRHYWTNIAFLDSKKAKNDMFELTQTELVDPALDYENHNNYKYSCCLCDNKLKSLSKPDCFNLGWMNNVGVDTARKTNYYWNHQVDSLICPICQLVYACIPAGFIHIYTRGIFVNSAYDINMLYRVNVNKNTPITDLTSGQIQSTEKGLYYQLMGAMEHTKNQKEQQYKYENIQIVRANFENEKRCYTFNVLSDKVLRVFARCEKQLNSISNLAVPIYDERYVNFYDEVLSRLINGQYLYSFIGTIIRNWKEKNENVYRFTIAYQLLGVQNAYEIRNEEERKMAGKQIISFRKNGENLKNAYMQSQDANKLSTISYQLINALRANNAPKFIEIILRAYSYVGDRIKLPLQMSTLLEEDSTNLQKFGYAFLIGLNGEPYKGDTNTTNNGQTEENNNGK